MTLAEVLRDGGYHTYMAGKWHLGHEPDQVPHARGFERSFSMLEGGASHWSDMTGLQATIQPVAKYTMDGDELEELPADFYSSRSYADFLIDAIRANRGDFKAVLVPKPFGSGEWRLYDTAGDPGEMRDLSAQQPAILAELKSAWEQYAGDVGVVSSKVRLE